MLSLADIVSSSDSAVHYAVPFVAGVLAHVCLFRIGEWDLRTTQLLVTFIAAQGALGVYVWKAGQDDGLSLYEAWKAAAGVSFIFLSGLYSSILIYRAAFHRLNRFPGPFAARLSNFYVTRLSIKKFQLFEEIQKLHEQYGDIVRVGMSSSRTSLRASDNTYQAPRSCPSPTQPSSTRSIPTRRHSPKAHGTTSSTLSSRST
jgi:cytochrome P450 family 628